MSKIMFFAHDPGGANAIAPLIDALKADHEVRVFAKGPALSRLPAMEWTSASLGEFAPDLLITGTSANDRTERELWREAAKHRVKTIAILDHWINYGIRFSKYGLNESTRFKKDPDIFPDFIVVMDDFAKEEMIKDGVPGEIIRVLGNPHFEFLRQQAQQARDIRSSIAGAEDFFIVFVSEAYIEEYGEGNEKCVLKELIDFTQKKKCKVMIKLHPKERREKYSEYPDQIIVHSEVSMVELLAASDLVVSMTSMGLIEAWIMGKRILSYQPYERDRNRFILTRRQVIPFINNKKDFEKNMTLEINHQQKLKKIWNINLNGTRDNLRFIEEVLCLN